jgi:hypothetical protein
MKNTNLEDIRNLLQENNYLKQELIKTLDEKENLVLLCEKLLKEKEQINRRYTNLKSSKLGRITIWMWTRRRKKNANR